MNDFSSRKHGMHVHPTLPCGGGSRAFALALVQTPIDIRVAMRLTLLVQKPVNHPRRGGWGGQLLLQETP